jgi:2-polyprenyl-6-methoxyphenol hydroxylase-like FAD-dependent oxidoreductase
MHYSACPDDLAPPLASPSLAFVRRDTLLARLRMQLSGDELQHGMVVEKVFRRGQKAVIESTDGTQFEADFVVAADGYRSR